MSRKKAHYDPIFDEHVVVNINTPEGKAFMEDMENPPEPNKDLKKLFENEKQAHYIEMLEDRINNVETTYARQKKVLEIIIKKNIRLGYFIEDFIKQDYGWSFYEDFGDNYHYGTDSVDFAYKGKDLTREEFDLVKEVVKSYGL